MKMIKISDVAHSKLMGMSGSVSSNVDKLLSGIKSRADLDIILDQLKMINDRLDPPTERAPIETSHSETKWEKFKREAAEEEKRIAQAINHPEEVDQSGGW